MVRSAVLLFGDVCGMIVGVDGLGFFRDGHEDRFTNPTEPPRIEEHPAADGRTMRFCLSLPRLWSNHVVDEAEFFEGQDRKPTDIELPPFVAVGGSSLVGMVVVMPAFAVGDQTDQPVVAAIVLGLVVSITPDMGHGVNAPGDVPVENRSDEYSPDEQTRSELDAAPEVPRHEPTDDKADDRIEGSDGKIDLEPIPLTLEFQVERVFQEVSGEALVVFDIGEISVLKHQPTEVSPEERDQGAVRIGLMV